jgi:hypothetical protein
MKLTKGQRTILEALATGRELTHYKDGGGWWLGNHQVNQRTCWSLKRKLLIKADDWGYCHITDWGRRALEDPDFEPPLKR